jgi:hypothetical protein
MSIIRFVQGKKTYLTSLDIEARENIAMPLSPSHTEMLSHDGKSYLGAHIEGGFMARPVGYDRGQYDKELFIDLGPDGDDAAYAYLDSIMNEPYDWTAIIDYLLPVDWHKMNHLICSAAMTLTLRKKLFFPWPLPLPAHLTSPRDLLAMVGARIQVTGI